MKLHLVAPFHTLCNQDYSHCAFTGKALRFSRMLQKQGFSVVEYANASTSEAEEKVNILTPNELHSLSSRTPDSFHGDDAKLGTELWSLFDSRLRPELDSRFQPEDILCLPFGNCHPGIEKDRIALETGIGYPHTFLPFRVYESYAWLHYDQGRRGLGGNSYHWVIPNYYEVADWKPTLLHGQYLLYFGRIVPCKGLNTIRELSLHTRLPIVLCGQGDPEPFLTDNTIYVPPISGHSRSDLLGNAAAVLMPTSFTEPFGGSGVEGLLCGTPLIGPDYGAFTETIIPGFNGFRCKTLGDWLEAIERIPYLNRELISSHARSVYSLEACGRRYASVFNQIVDNSWYCKTSRNIPCTSHHKHKN